MALTSNRVTRRQTAFPVAVTALAVAAAITLATLMQFFLGVGVTLQLPTPRMAARVFSLSLVQAGPFGVGLFLSLWLFAPIRRELRIGQVVVRAVLATGVGVIFVFIVSGVLAVVGAFGIDGPLFSNSLGGFFDPGTALYGLRDALVHAVTMLVTQLPLGVLAGVLLWVWHREQLPRHPQSVPAGEV